MPQTKKRAKSGEASAWLNKHASHRGKECLIWPFATTSGRAWFDGAKSGNANRFMCELAHGKPPSPEHQAAHSCGKGHLGCINPGHLRWATHLENEADKIIHGTLAIGEKSNLARLTAGQVIAIRAAISDGEKQVSIAKRFGVTKGNVTFIKKRITWAWL